MQRGDIVEVQFYFPSQNFTQNHMAIVLSVPEVWDVEETFVCVPISSKEEYDCDYTLPIDPTNIDGQYKIFGGIRLHLITAISKRQLLGPTRLRVRNLFLNQIYKRINSLVFGI